MVKKGQIKIGYKSRRIAFSGEERFVGQASRYSTIGYQAITAYAAKAAAVPESSIEMSMEAIFDALNYFVMNGHSVQIPYIGTFSLSVRAKSAESEADFTNNFQRNLRNININFLPASEIKALIASTSITTEASSDETDGYGVIAVSNAYFGVGNALFPMNEGRPYELESDSISRFVLNGTRLSEKYGARVIVTFLKSDGTEESGEFAGVGITRTYNSFSFNIKELKKTHRNWKAVKKIEVKDGDNVVWSKTFSTPSAKAEISGVNIGGKAVAENATVPFVAGQAVNIRLLLSIGDGYDDITVGGQRAQIVSGGEGEVTVRFTPSASGNYPIVVTSPGGLSDTYNISFGVQGGVSISRITANGDPLNNGSTTNIVAGSNYNVTISGTGLDNMTENEFELPAGSSININSQSATLINATINNAQAGDFKVKNPDGEYIFTSALVAVVPGISVTGYKLTAGGATQSLATAVNANADTGAFSIILVGNDVDDLATANFSGTGLSSLSYDAATATLTGVVDSGTRSLVIRDNETTIANISIIKPTNGGSGGDGLDTD